MRTLSVFAAGGLVSWLMRVAFIALIPVGRIPKNLTGVLQHASPAAFAALAAAAVSSTEAGPGPLSGWPVVAATLTTLVVARRAPHSVLILVVGATTATLFAALS